MANGATTARRAADLAGFESGARWLRRGLGCGQWDIAFALMWSFAVVMIAGVFVQDLAQAIGSGESAEK